MGDKKLVLLFLFPSLFSLVYDNSRKASTTLVHSKILLNREVMAKLCE
jgi:hypothetical protein